MALTVYSTTWCGPCRRLKSQLQRAGIDYRAIDIDRDPEAARYVRSVNNGNQTVPTVRIVSPQGEHVLTNPSIATIKRLIG